MKFFRKILKICLYCGIALVLTIGAITLLTQTQFFRDRLRVILITTFSNQMNGELTLGTIRGSFFKGFTLDSLGIYCQGRPVVRTGKVAFAYDILPLFDKKIQIRYVTVERPTLTLTRSATGGWNFLSIIKPSGDTTQGVFVWTGTFDDLELLHGSVTLFDSLEQPKPDTTFPQLNYHDFAVNDLNLKLHGSFTRESFDVHLADAGCSVANSSIAIAHISGELHLDEHHLRAEKVRIRTGNSDVGFDATLSSTKRILPESLPEFQHDSASLTLKADRIDFDELKFFLPPVGFLNGSASLDLKAGGEFGDIYLRQANIRFSQTSLRLSGNIRNLHRPDQLLLKISIPEGKVNPRDISRLMPGFGIPTFDSLGATAFSAQFDGTPVDFLAKVLVQTRAGTVETDGKLQFTDSIPRYDIAFGTRNLDLRKVLKNPELASVLNSHGTLKGAGVNLRSLQSNLTLSLDSSRFRDLTIDTAEIFLHGAARQVEATCSLTSHASQADLNARADFSNPDVTAFSSEVALASFDIAPLLRDPRYQSDLTLRGSLRGSGSDIDNINTDINLSVLPSKFQNHAIPQDTFQLSLDQKDHNKKHLLLNSSIANVKLEGSFDLDLAAAMVAERLSNLLASVRNHALPPDSVKPAKTTFSVPPHSPAQHQMDFSYQIQLKDLEPVATLLSKTPFDGHADISGGIRTTQDNLSLTCDGTIGEFYYGTSDNGFILNNCTIAAELDSLGGEDVLENLSCNLDATMTGANFNSLRLENARCRFLYKHTRGNLLIRGIFDSLYTMNIIGETSIQPGSYVFDVDTLSADLGQFHWSNSQDVQFRINYDGTRILHAEMLHNDAVVSGTGALHYSGGIEGSFTLKNFDLNELNLWLPHDRIQTALKNFSGKCDLNLEVSGAIENPIFQIGMKASHVEYRQSSIGAVFADILYRDTTAHLDITLRGEGADSLSSLQVRGTLPINLALTGVEERFPEHQQDITITSKHSDLGIFNPLIGEVEDLKGKLTADISVRGTPRYPDYSGSIELRNVDFIFVPNNVEYLVSGDMQPSGDKIALQNFTLRNTPINGKQAEAQIKGTLTIQDYAISQFDITAFGQLFLMSDATRSTGLSLYGPLLTETDASGLNLRGSFEHPMVTGKLSILDANLVFPPTKATPQTSNQLSLNHVVIDDTTSRVKRSKKISKFYNVGEGMGIASKNEAREQNILFVDRLRYNVTAETKGTTAIKMIFTPETNEELYAELEGKVSIINEWGTPTVNGEITVLPHSYYNFIKRFDATGSLNFVGQWDNPDLKIQATYEDYHIIDSLSKSGTTTQEKVIVVLNITGNRYEPKLAMAMKVQQTPGTEAIDWSTQAKGGDIQSDAISFILTGKFKDELTSADRRNLTSNVGSTASSSFTSTLLSGILTNFLRSELPFLRIRDASITYQGGTPDVRISGDILQGYLQFGGKILNNIANANVSYQVNLGEILKNSSIHNLFLEIQHRDSELIEDRKTDEARIYYRFSF